MFPVQVVVALRIGVPSSFEPLERDFAYFYKFASESHS